MTEAEWMNWLLNLKLSFLEKQMIYAIVTAGLYHIWWARNQKLFQRKDISSNHIAQQVKTQAVQRILYRNTQSHKFDKCIGQLLR